VTYYQDPFARQPRKDFFPKPGRAPIQVRDGFELRIVSVGLWHAQLVRPLLPDLIFTAKIRANLIES
jgi:hypothetical protein